jgi:hypothetical protein
VLPLPFPSGQGAEDHDYFFVALTVLFIVYTQFTMFNIEIPKKGARLLKTE